ncbi:MAG TPA: hypothetical protein VGE00_02135 [Gammaproteobacteria bacterium]
MAVWLAPALKAVLPHLGSIVSAVAPAFTRKRADAAANQTQLLQEQIAELQNAAAQNNEYIRELAAQLQTTITALEQSAAIAERRIRMAVALAVVALVMSIGTLLTFILLQR